MTKQLLAYESREPNEIHRGITDAALARAILKDLGVTRGPSKNE